MRWRACSSGISSRARPRSDDPHDLVVEHLEQRIGRGADVFLPAVKEVREKNPAPIWLSFPFCDFPQTERSPWCFGWMAIKSATRSFPRRPANEETRFRPRSEE